MGDTRGGCDGVVAWDEAFTCQLIVDVTVLDDSRARIPHRARHREHVRNIEAEELGMAVLRLENGALAQIEGTTATVPSKHTAEFSVFCENGQLSMGLDSGKPHLNIFSVKPDGKLKKLNGYYIRRQFKEGGLFSYKCALNPHLGIYKDLSDSIIENKAPIADAYSGFSSVDTLLGIYRSAKEGRPVQLPLTDDFNSVDMTGFFD